MTETTATPNRLSATHYQIESATQHRTYDLIYNYEIKKWVCNCPDTRHNHNPRCKHRRRLNAWIAEQMTASKAQAQATAILEKATPQQLTLDGIQERLEHLEKEVKRLDKRKTNKRGISQKQRAEIRKDARAAVKNEIKELKEEMKYDKGAYFDLSI